jgi:hypothetical protein
MAMLAKTPGPGVGTPTRFHPDTERRQIGDKTWPFTAREALSEHHVPGAIHADDVKHEFCDIDPEYADYLWHGTRLV